MVTADLQEVIIRRRINLREKGYPMEKNYSKENGYPKKKDDSKEKGDRKENHLLKGEGLS